MAGNLDTLHGLLDKALALGADAADAIMLETTDINSSRRLKNPERLERSESKAIGLRGFIGQGSAIVSSTDTSRQSLEALAERVVAMAKIAPPDPHSGLAPPELHAQQFPDLDLCDANEPAAVWLDEQCAEAEDAALAVAGITNSEGADAYYGKSSVSLAITHRNGRFAREYAASYFSVSVSVLAGKDTDMQRDYDFTNARHREDLTPSAAVGKNAAEYTLRRMGSRKISSCKVPVVFDPRVSRSLLAIFAGAISGPAVTRGATFLKDAMDKKIFSSGISIVDNPHIVRGLASKPFDAEGLANQKRQMVDKGELKSWLLDIRSANKLGLAPTGHASRGIASPPSAAATNLYMENGKESVRSLLAGIKNGLYVTETFGSGVNVVTGDYSQGAAGFWIENGVISYPVSEITIAGRLSDMFAHMEAADDLVFRYGVNAPTVRIETMTVAGT